MRQRDQYLIYPFKIKMNVDLIGIYRIIFNLKRKILPPK